MTLTHSTELDQAIDRFWETIPPLWNQVRSHLRALASEEFDISVEQFHILRHVRHGITSVSELAAVKRISRPAVSQAVELLVERGLLARETKAGDRRFITLSLTTPGETLLDTVFAKNRAWMGEKLSILSEGELRCLLTAMDVLQQSFYESESQDR